MLKEVVYQIFGGAWPMIVIFTIILSSIRINSKKTKTCTL